MAALPTDHPLAANASIELHHLIDEPFIVSHHAPGPEIHDYIIRKLSVQNTGLTIAEHGVGRETLLSMVGLGFGVTLVSGAEAEVRYPGVAFVPIAGEMLLFSAVWSPANSNPALRRFLSAARLMSNNRRHISQLIVE